MGLGGRGSHGQLCYSHAEVSDACSRARRRRWGWWAAAGSCPGAASPCPRGSTRCSRAPWAAGRPQATGSQGKCPEVPEPGNICIKRPCMAWYPSLLVAGAFNEQQPPALKQVEGSAPSLAGHVPAKSTYRLPAQRLRCMAADVPLTVLLSRTGYFRATCCAHSWAHAWRARRGWRTTWSVLHARATRLRCTCSGSGQDPVHHRVLLQAESMRHRGRLLVPAALLAEAAATARREHRAAKPED